MDDSVKLAAILIGSQLLVVATFVLFALGAIDGQVIQMGVFLILLIPALVLLTGRGGGVLIAGYNTLPESEKAKYNRKALSQAVGMLLLAMDLAVFLFTLSLQRGMEWPLALGIVVCIAAIIGSLVWINAGERYKRHDA